MFKDNYEEPPPAPYNPSEKEAKTHKEVLDLLHSEGVIIEGNVWVNEGSQSFYRQQIQYIDDVLEFRTETPILIPFAFGSSSP